MVRRRLRHWGPTLQAKVLFSSIGLYLLLSACIILLWSFGAPGLGLPGRVPEIMGQERTTLRSAAVDTASRLDLWLAARQGEATALASIDSRSVELDLVAAPGGSGPAAEQARRSLEARYLALCAGPAPQARIIIARSADDLVIVDSSGEAAGAAFAFQARGEKAEYGQFRVTDSIVSFRAARTIGGTEITFGIVEPLASFLKELKGGGVDIDHGFGIALADAQGKLVTPLVMPDLGATLARGLRFAGKERLEEMVSGGGTVAFPFGKATICAAAGKVALSSGDAIFVTSAIPRSRAASRIASDIAAMALTALLLAASASILTVFQVRTLLAPLASLHAAVESFGRSEAFVLPERTSGEIGEITRAFGGLVKRVEEWKGGLESEVESRTSMLKLTTELCRIYASDNTESASMQVMTLFKEYMGAAAAAQFYMKGRDEYRYYLVGGSLPTTLPETEWRECARRHDGGDMVSRSGAWAPPGLDRPLPSWMSYRLYSTESEGRYLFLGKAEGEWSAEEEARFVAVSKTIAPIIRVRREREFVELLRIEAERKLAENERRLRTFLEGSRDMIYTVDSSDAVTGINAAGVALLGRSRKDEVVGQPFSSFVLNLEDRDQLLRRVREVGYAADYEIVLKRADGSSVFCLETAYAIRSPAGEILELQGIVKDITERISSESALWKTNIELADANMKIQRAQNLMVQHEKLASIGQLAAGVAHEINNPLGFLKSNHEMFEKYIKTFRSAWEEAKAAPDPDLAEIERRKDLGYLFEEMDSMLAESADGFSRIMHIVGNLKSFSRTEQGAEFTPYDVNAGLESTLIVARNEIKYVADVKKELGELPQIKARGSEINQVFLNILVNAAQAIAEQKREAKGLIVIRTAVVGDYVVVGIRDDGPGIPEGIRLKIFDPFFTTKEPGKGTGLGLSISYDIVVSKHGGRLTADSTPGVGTTFTIELPIKGPPIDEATEA